MSVDVMCNCSDILDDFFTNEELDIQLLSINDLNKLNILLKIKQKRIFNGVCDKILFPIENIYKSTNGDINFICVLLKKALFINCGSNLNQIRLLNDFLEKIPIEEQTDQMNALKLIDVITEYYNSQKKNNNFSILLETIHNKIIVILKQSSKQVSNYMVTNILLNLFELEEKYGMYDIFCKDIYETANTTRNLNIICTIFRQITLYLKNNNDFWLLLKDCLCNYKNTDLQKQAIFLLKNLIGQPLINNNKMATSIVVNQKEIDNAWKNWFVLLDLSNEKQLHLIQPSLHLLKTIKSLNPLWQTCLFQIFLEHNQISIVYFVVVYIMQCKYNRIDRKITNYLLLAINRNNEFSLETKKMFEEMQIFSIEMTNEEFIEFLEASLNLKWIPTIIWGFYKSVFTNNASFILPIKLLQNLLQGIKSVPDIFIREACYDRILTVFLKNYKFQTVDELTVISRILLEINESKFTEFIENNDKITQFTDLLLQKIEKSNDLQLVLIQLKILNLLPINNKIAKMQPSQKSDLIYLILFKKFTTINIVNYILNRIDSIQVNDEYFFKLCEKIEPNESLETIACNILATKSNEAQRNFAVFIINKNKFSIKNYSQKVTSFIDYYKSIFLSNNRKIPQYLAIVFLDLYFESNFNSTEAELICEKYFCTQNDIVSIKIFSKLSKMASNICFVEKCFEKLLTIKRPLFKKATETFINESYQYEMIININKSVYWKITEKLMELAKNYGFITEILSSKINGIQLIQRGCKESIILHCFSNTMLINLMLLINITHKTERIQYCVYQDIQRTDLKIVENPNFNDISIRLMVLDYVMTLADGYVQYFSKFTKLLIEKYNEDFNKRYFPDSEIHLRKTRIIQTLLLIQGFMDDKQQEEMLISFILDCLLMENHQDSVKHLLQFLLILLGKRQNSIKTILTKMKNAERLLTIPVLIPVIYHLVLDKDELIWEEIAEFLLPLTMGAQFKLRIFSQVALMLLYEEAEKKDFASFTSNYKITYKSIKLINLETINYKYEFLLYFSMDCNHTDILYVIPKETKVSITEWENILQTYERYKDIYLYLKLSLVSNEKIVENTTSPFKIQWESTRNIQKKIVPWREFFEEENKALTDFILIGTLVDKSTNLGGLSRTCEIFGVKQFVLKTRNVLKDKEFQSLSMTSENWLNITQVGIEELHNFLKCLKSRGYTVIGAEQTCDSCKLDKFTFPRKTALLLGNEKEGIPADLLSLMDYCVEIPQFGLVRSLNVHVAGAVLIWEYCKQYSLNS